MTMDQWFGFSMISSREIEMSVGAMRLEKGADWDKDNQEDGLSLWLPDLSNDDGLGDGEDD
ncbi:hypothetical protein D8674_021003 [Pyrus ussuriensis x Pyrus communis]|uniref:Uncharacterized protein n=1 Tax=Pyrus ussuriensis x Pyrus communis TaxID=2448454 RepID=A0A5N5HHS7_9ROSA|nr:hypothetical protein D8674_021003 [Pyrus ussuriensis x Pyrus communis]